METPQKKNENVEYADAMSRSGLFNLVDDAQLSAKELRMKAEEKASVLGVVDERLEHKARAREEFERRARVVAGVEGDLGTDGLRDVMESEVFQAMAARGGEYRLRKHMHRQFLQEKADRLNAAITTYLARAKSLLLGSTSAMAYVI